MRFSTTATALLAASMASAAPVWPSINLGNVRNPFAALDNLSGYFNAVATKVAQAKVISVAPQCDPTKARMPTIDGLPGPSPGLHVRHVAVGRGTQNYTCAGSKPEDAPKAVGAVATLFDVTCMASLYPDVTNRVPGMAVHFNMDDSDRLGPSTLPISGHHFFTGSGVPFFNLDTATGDIGLAPCAKNASVAAPADAPVGQNGEAAVAWLKLTTIDGATGNLKDVFRVETAGGSPPKTCQGQPDHIEVEYSAQYWFWAS